MCLRDGENGSRDMTGWGDQSRRLPGESTGTYDEDQSRRLCPLEETKKEH